MNQTKISMLIVACLGLSACMGGGDGDGSTGVYGENGLTLAPSAGAGSGVLSVTEVASLGDAFDALSDAVDAGTYVAPTERPTGEVTMTGYIGINEVDVDDPVIGKVSLTADFDASDVTGTASDFQEYDVSGDTPIAKTELPGTLAITGTNAGTGFAADMTGDLTADGETLTFDLDLSGNLYDVDGTNTYLGGVDGTYTDGADDFDIEGDFVIQ